MKEEDLIRGLIEFAEENWNAFIQTQEERGDSEDDVESAISKLQEKI